MQYSLDEFGGISFNPLPFMPILTLRVVINVICVWKSLFHCNVLGSLNVYDDKENNSNVGRANILHV